MKKLDLYILKQYLKTFFFFLLISTMITVAVDYSEKADAFIKSGLSASEIFYKYYIGFIPHITALLFPVFVLIAVVFFTSRLAARSEVVAMLSVGVGLKRFLLPYWIGSILLAVLLLISNHQLVPVANRIRTEFEARYINDPDPAQRSASQYQSNLHFRVDTFTYAGMRYFDTAVKNGSGFYLQRLKNNQVVYNIRSQNFQWDTTTKRWKLQNVVERKIDGMKESVRYFPDTSMQLGYLPSELISDHYRKDKLKTSALKKLIRQERLRGAEGINAMLFERYRRDANAISVIIMTLMGAILASRKARGGSGLHLALAFVIGVAFILFDKFSMVFSVKANLPPLIAAWLPNVIFSVVAMQLFVKAPK